MCVMSIVASPSGFAVVVARRGPLVVIWGVFFLLAHPRARVAAFFIWAHSQRETWSTPHGSTRDVVHAGPRPTGSLTARVLGNGGSALPRVRTCLLLLTRPPSVITWDCASSFAPARLSRAPRSGCNSPLRPLPSVSPFQTQGVSVSLTRLLLVVHNTTLTRHHSSPLCLVTPSVAS